jgi:hypothetical protein
LPPPSVFGGPFNSSCRHRTWRDLQFGYLGGTSPNSTTFGRITSAYRDTVNAVDPGGRILEFVLRVNF